MQYIFCQKELADFKKPWFFIGCPTFWSFLINGLNRSNYKSSFHQFFHQHFSVEKESNFLIGRKIFFSLFKKISSLNYSTLNFFHVWLRYTLDVLWGQPIKLIQVVSKSEFHEYWWNNFNFKFLVSAGPQK